MSSEVKGRIYDIQGFTVQDGPGIRTTVFLKGCPLRCLWCHSPESQSFEPEISYMEIKCVGIEKCGACLKICGDSCLAPGEPRSLMPGEPPITPVKLNFESCGAGLELAAACPAKAIYICGTEYTVGQVLERVMQDAAFYRKSGGGVTLSGGEPMSQFEFTLALLKACKSEGLHTALDTTGFAGFERYRTVLPYVDLLLYDLKHMDSKAHKRLTGVPNGIILENARRLAELGAKFQMRIPLIPSMNDDADNIEAAGRFCASLGGAVESVQLLPYHKLGTAKYERIGRRPPMPEDIGPPPDERVQEVFSAMKAYVDRVTIH